jgi:hypothetical protein
MWLDASAGRSSLTGEPSAVPDRGTWIGDQIMLPQSHCVDVLLDLPLGAHDPTVKSTIEDRLRDIRFVSMVEADEIRADLEAAAFAISSTAETIDLT